MDTNLYSDHKNLTDNIGDILVHWMRKVLESRVDKTRGSVKNEQSNDQHTDAFKHRKNERMERKAGEENAIFSRRP